MHEALMTKYFHIPGRENCPHLPPASQVIRPSEARRIRETQDVERAIYSTLTCAQSLWLEGKPAQALLQLNHVLGIAELTSFTAYKAKVWMFQQRHLGGFLGNPVRHYQHLASRVSGDLKDLRSWRAWACFHLAEQVLEAREFPRDLLQIEKEKLIIPSWDDVMLHMERLASAGEASFLSHLFLDEIR
ncbi:MAG: hypothetical protein ACSHX0_03450 [Akkermansiaceae bacterium]